MQYIFADFNTRVKSGQVLAQLDPAIYEAQVTQARGNLQTRRRTLSLSLPTFRSTRPICAKAQANAAYEKATAKRSQDLFTAGVVSADSNDLTQSTLGQSQADVQAAQAALAQAKAQLKQAHAQVTSMEGALKAAETSLKYTTHPFTH